MKPVLSGPCTRAIARGAVATCLVTSMSACGRPPAAGGPPTVTVPGALPPSSGPTPAPDAPMTAGTTVRPGDLLAQPARFVGRRVRVDIVEPLEGGPEAPEQIASSEFGYYRVAVPDSGGGRLSLVAPAFRLQDAARYHAKFDRVLAPPLRVEGDFLDDTDNASSPDADHAYVLRVTRAEPLDLGAPVRITSVEALGTEGRYDRALVEIAGDVRRGFEVSAIEGKIWVSSAAYRDHALGRPSSPGSHVGILYARKGARFGHLGAYSYELIVPRND